MLECFWVDRDVESFMIQGTGITLKGRYTIIADSLVSPVNMLSIDVEDWFHIIGLPSTPPLERWTHLESRVEANTLSLLNLMERHHTRGTFFVLGWVAQHFPDLIKEIERRGHEIGTHGYNHIPVNSLTPEKFRRDVGRSLDCLSKTVKKPIRGYRAPGFSLSRTEAWAWDILLELGLQYDSSLFGIKPTELAGKSGFQTIAWMPTPHGARILEAPLIALPFMGQSLYFFGGGYMRLTPYKLIASGIRHLNRAGESAMVYLHPRELDTLQPRLPMNPLRRFMCYVNLRTTSDKMEHLLSEFRFESIGRMIDSQLKSDTVHLK